MSAKASRLFAWFAMLALLAFIVAACQSSVPRQSGPTQASTSLLQKENPIQTDITPIPPGSPTGGDEGQPGEGIDEENGAAPIDWGQEVGQQEMLELAHSGNVLEIQWHVMPNVVRILMKDGKIYHFMNDRVSIDIAKFLEKQGVKTGKGGIPLRYSFCN